MQQARRRLLRHDLTKQQDQVFQSIRDACVAVRPGNPFLNATMRRAFYLTGSIKKRLRIPQTTTSSHCRTSVRVMIVPRRPQCGHRHPVLCGLMPRCKIPWSSRTANQVTLKPFIRKRRESNLLLVISSSFVFVSLGITNKNNPVGACDPIFLSKNYPN